MDRYVELWQRFLCFCYRIIGDQQTYGVEFLDEQIRVIWDLKTSLELGVIHNDTLDEKVFPLKNLSNQKIEALSVSFLKHSDFALQKSSLIYFCGILGFNIQLHQWLDPSPYTQTLAGLQFCIRVILLEHALPSVQRDGFRDVHPTPLERFRRIHVQYLVEGEEYPFNYIHKLLNYGMQASKNCTTRSRIRWSTDNQMLFWVGRNLY